jgi:hypothetical protein
MKLHTINKKKPTKKFVGRKRKTAEEEGEEHHPITARGLRDPLSAWKFDGVFAGDEAVRPRLLHLPLLDSRSHPVGHGVCQFSLGHDVFRCKVLLAHPNLCLGAVREKETDAEIGNGGGGGEGELVNSKKPYSLLIYLLSEGMWAETWRMERKRQPTNGQENIKLPRYP